MTRLRPFGCAYDSYGRITQKASRNIHYHDAARPHWPSEVHAGTTTTPVAHDLNGNRTRARGGNPDYTYDAWDRLKSVAVSTGSVEFVYDYSGRRVAKLVHSFLGTGVTFYYSELAELSGNQLFKSYYLGGLRVASQRKSCTGCELAALTPTEAVRLAAVSLKSPALVVLLRRDVELALAAALVLFGTGVLLAPWKRRRVVGITLRHGQVIVVAVFFLSGTFPWPILLRPAEAQCGNPPTPTPQPTPTATPVSVGEVRHYHTDHLGSTQVVTDINGLIVEQIRYQPYGEVRGRFDGLGNPITNPSAAYRYEFTGYESEILSGLLYAGARFYDPTLGLFLTQDPARQFASPYTYTGWDPMNLTDPSGAFVGGLIAGILAVAKIIANYAVPIAITVGFGTAFGQTLANGGSFGQAFAAGAMGGLIGGVGAYGLGIAGGYVASKNPMLSYALAAVAIAGSTYQTVESFRSGQYVAGAVGAVFVAFGVASLLAASAQGGDGTQGFKAPSSGKADAWKEGLSEFDYASIEPTSRGEFVTEIILNGEVQVEMDIARYGSSRLRGALADFTGKGGITQYSPHYWKDPITAVADPLRRGDWVFVGQVGTRYYPPQINLYPGAFESLDWLRVTYIHELGHQIGLSDTIGFTAYQFHQREMDILKANRLR